MEFFFLQFTLLYVAILECCASINLALNKATKRNSPDTNTCYKASNAVDGVIGNQVDSCCCCSLPAYEPLEAWLEVDLSSISRIQGIEVFHRRMWEYKSFGYHILVSNFTELKDELYYKDTNPGGPPPVQNITGRTTARYVTLYNNYTGFDGSNGMAVLDLCEVKIYGCPLGQYGIQCEQQCSIGCKQGYFCEPDNGQCVGGCESGWTGPKCDDCADGRYGEYCENHCSIGCLHGTCDRSGTCIGGCEVEFEGKFCKKCINGRYGIYCNTNCSIGCINITCDKESAHCIHGCNANWDGPTCTGPGTIIKVVYDAVPGVVGGIVGVLVITIIFVVIIVILRRKWKNANSEKNSNYEIPCRHTREPIQAVYDELNLQKDSNYEILCTKMEKANQSDYNVLTAQRDTSDGNLR